ncbi:MAG: ABC transporter permease [Phycisphaerae bacterium]|nr:ABC transporter permease [Phycisphaerae bacterium]
MISRRAWQPLLGPIAGLAIVAIVFGASVPDVFLSSMNMRTVLVQNAALILGAVGMTFVIIAGGIDLSVGSVMALSSVTTALVLKSTGSPGTAALCGVLTGLAIGIINGLLVAGLRIAPFVATLGTLGAARGLAKWLAQNERVAADPGWLGEMTVKLPVPSWLLIAPSVWVALLTAVLAAIVLRNTVFGVHAQAIGSSEPTARLCGVRVLRTKVLVYAISGLCAGTAGTLLFARLTVGDPTGAFGMELAVVAAVVIGGASLRGGEGTIAGSVLGALMLGLLASGCNLRGWSNAIQEVITGGIIVLAVAIDAWPRERE